MRDKAILENGGTLKPVRDCNKNQEICNKSVYNYLYVLEFVVECYKTQEICDTAVDTQPSTIKLVPECCQTQEFFNKADNFLYLILFLFGIKLKKRGK